MSETRDDLREALARAEQAERERDAAIKVQEMCATSGAFWAKRAETAEAQVSALQAEVERLQKVEGEREKDAERVPCGSGSRPSDQAPAGLAPSGFDPSRDRVTVKSARLIAWEEGAVEVVLTDGRRVALVLGDPVRPAHG